jgi:hypothetical protein
MARVTLFIALGISHMLLQTEENGMCDWPGKLKGPASPVVASAPQRGLMRKIGWP